MKLKKRIVLAYSGGLDTSIILKWLQENYNAEVICYTADIGQKIDKKKIISNAKKLGVKNIIIQDLKNIFVKDYVFPMVRGHAIYEGVYLLGTSIARPLIAKDQIRVAKKYKASNTAFFTTDAITFLKDLGVKHLVVDMPSIDRINDNGMLGNHHRYFENKPPFKKTITELAFIPDSLDDGSYFMVIEIPPMQLDAAPSRPFLFKYEEK